MAKVGSPARPGDRRNRVSRPRRSAGRARPAGADHATRRFVPKVPRLIQHAVDQLIEKAQVEGLTRREQRLLDEVLDYLADLTIHELERMRDARRPRRAI